MTILFFSNADYYKNEEFQKLMLNYNYFMKDKDTVNPLDLTQWDFYILDTEVLNKKLPTQKTITLSSLLKLDPVKAKYDGLKTHLSF